MAAYRSLRRKQERPWRSVIFPPILLVLATKKLEYLPKDQQWDMKPYEAKSYGRQSIAHRVLCGKRPALPGDRDHLDQCRRR
jgi:hypothetical protein